jgi:hypothetical protein
MTIELYTFVAKILVMSKSFGFLCMLFCFTGFLFAQEDTLKPQQAWKLESVYGFNATQSSFVNWVGGGRNNVSALAFVNGTANYKKGTSNWNTELRLALGGVQFFDEARIQKTDDIINLATKYGYEFQKTWFFTALGDFRTQFMDGFVNPIDTLPASRFMAPAFSIFALGIDYKPSKDFSILMAPATGKFTFVNDQRLSDLGAFGVTPGTRFRPELGAYVKFRWRKDLMKNIEMVTRAEFFSNYLDRPQNVDVNIEAMFTFKVNDWFSAMLQVNVLYDDDIRIPVTDANGNVYQAPRTQFRQIMGIGLQYRLANHKK